MSKEDKLFNFMASLQSSEQLELRRQAVQNVAQAIAAADHLVDYQMQQEGQGKRGKNEPRY